MAANITAPRTAIVATVTLVCFPKPPPHAAGTETRAIHKSSASPTPAPPPALDAAQVGALQPEDLRAVVVDDGDEVGGDGLAKGGDSAHTEDEKGGDEDEGRAGGEEGAAGGAEAGGEPKEDR